MMDTVVEIIGSLLLITVDIFIAFLFSEMIESILHKDRMWMGILPLILGIIMLQAAVYSWLPGRFGYAIQLFDGAITLQDGATLSNLGAILVVQALAIGIMLLKYIWSAIRKENRFVGKFFALEVLFLLLFGTAGVLLFENDDMIALSKDSSISSALLSGLFFGGLLLVTLGIMTMKRSK